MGSLPNTAMRKIESICIIGAGPAGLAAAKYLLSERAFSRIQILEQRANVGGLWNYTPCDAAIVKSQTIPQTSPHTGRPTPLWRGSTVSGGSLTNRHVRDGPEFLSPLYDRLETNIPRGLMGFSDLDWPQDRPLFPTHDQVLQYIEAYAKDVEHLITFKTQVLEVRKGSDQRWRVKTQQVTPDGNGVTSEQIFDAVAVASGHFDVPYIPPVPGMEEWNRAYPEVLSHSKFYRTPENYAGKTVIVVGNSASGVDIAAQIARNCKAPLLHSLDVDLCAEAEEAEARVNKPRIEEFVVKDRSVRFADDSIESNVDAIIYCTGYLYSFPFLDNLDPPPVTTGTHVENLFQHIFYRIDPSLAFLVLNQKVIPFPMSEAQSAVIARVWSGRLLLPDYDDMQAWEERLSTKTERPRNFHLLPFPQDADHINMLHDWAMSADDTTETHQEYRRRRLSKSEAASVPPQSNDVHTANGIPSTTGKEPPQWGEKEYWLRERFPAIKHAYQAYGEERYGKRTLEDVGFDFARWNSERAEEAKRLL